MILGTTNREPEKLKPAIEAGWANVTADLPLTQEQSDTVEEAVGMLNRGRLRVAEPLDGKWITHPWVKQAILMYFQIEKIVETVLPPFQWVDKIAIKRWTTDMGVRVVPPAVVRYGAFVQRGCVLMPSYVNIGAHVDEGTMVDTWATVGSCAQIGKNVHLSGGVGIGGVLEPLQTQPVIIEDHCFIGSRAVIVEGVHVRSGAVIGAGVILTASTPIVDVTWESPKISKGMIPENRVVIPGSMEKKFPAGNFHVPCALIIGTRNASTDRKTSLTQVLRDFAVPV